MKTANEIYAFSIDDDENTIQNAINLGRPVAVPSIGNGRITWECHNFSEELFIQFSSLVNNVHGCVEEVRKCLIG